MANGHFGLKAAPRLSNDNKAQAANKSFHLAQSPTMMSNELDVKAELKLGTHGSETFGATGRHADLEPTNPMINTFDFIIPSIEFSHNHSTIATTTTSKALQQTTALGPVSADRADSVETLKPSASFVQSKTTGCASTEVCPDSKSAASFPSDDEDLLTDITTSTETTLSVHSTTLTPLHSSTQQPSLSEIPPVTGLEDTKMDVPANRSKSSSTAAGKESKRGRPKFVQVLYKLKAKIWPWRREEGSDIETKEEEEEEEDFLDRCQWDVIKKIETTKIKEIVRSALLLHGYDEKSPLVITSYTRGTYHLVVMLKALHPYTKKLVGWVIKIPGHGTAERWTAEDEYMLTQEVETMRLLTMETEIPSPWVIDYSATLDNKYGFPYIVMKELPGKSASELWFDEHCEIPTPETEMKRLTFLRSLARHMTELNKLRFDQIGMPMYNMEAPDFENYDDIETERLPVGKYYVWPYCDAYDSVERGPFPSTQAYIEHAVPPPELPPLVPGQLLTDEQVEVFGTHKLLTLIFSHPVFHTPPSSTFALRHSDLDTQNILIDASGAVTGILDWDASLAMPRCVGHAAVPHFLDRDFHPNAIVNTPFLCWRAGYYRSVYAAALVEAGNPDARFTTKSHMYQAAFAALYEGGNVQDFLARVVRAVPRLQVGLWDVKFLMAKGCKATEEMLKLELWKLLEPELPEEGLLERVEKQHDEAAVQVWMDGFEGLAVEEM
ncbi:hypothetical protein EKO04_009949 [Ascochyta lentis]|uniref:Aminoglycoside phosphotransferase domain-containing protein n=1 Tax=Ascochyta lentis TaxID=205686 RepID=A0A8H7IV48_9PLEO|nr:hypothetical protein EKO04_009949 [Ascochyta lentis]